MDGSDLLQRWRDRNKAHRFEGDSGLENLEKLCEDLGYHNSGFRFGTPIECFLSDNPGAVEKILEFIEERADRPGDPHREALASVLEVDPDEDEENEEACPGCGCMPGDGLTEGCEDEAGCGHYRKMEQEDRT